MELQLYKVATTEQLICRENKLQAPTKMGVTYKPIEVWS